MVARQRSVMAGAMPAGVEKPNQLVLTTAGKPASVKLGTSGREASRAGLAGGQRPQPVGAEMRQGDGQAFHHRGDLPADRIGQRRGGAAIGHVGQLDPGGAGEQHADQVVHRAIAAGAVGEAAGAAFRQRDELGQALRRHAGVDHQHAREGADRARHG